MIRPTRHRSVQPSDRLFDGDIVLAESDIPDLGLEEAPSDAGPSWEEILDRKNRSNGNG